MPYNPDSVAEQRYGACAGTGRQEMRGRELLLQAVAARAMATMLPAVQMLVVAADSADSAELLLGSVGRRGHLIRRPCSAIPYRIPHLHYPAA